MNCADAESLLVDRLYGELPPDTDAQLRDHLAACDSCRRELASLEHTRRLLDTTPEHKASLDAARLYPEAAAQSDRARRRWRLTALSASAAAIILVALTAALAQAHLRIQRDPGRVTISWRIPNEPQPHDPATAQPQSPAPAPRDPWPTLSQHTDRLTTLDELVRHVVKELDSSDQQHRAQLTALQRDLQDLRLRNNLRLDVLDRDISDTVTLLTSSLPTQPKKGPQP